MPYSKKTLGELTTFVASGITPRGGNSTYVVSGPQLIRSQNVLMGSLSLENVARIDREIFDSMRRVRVLFDDVLLNITGASIGRVCRVGIDLGEAVVNQHVAIIRTRNEVLSPTFLSYVLRTERLQQTILSGQTGAAQGGFNHQKIRALEIPLPSLPEQDRIVEILDQADTLRQQRRQAGALSQRILPALFQEMFGGTEWPRKPISQILKTIQGGWSPVCDNRPAAAGEWGVLKLGAATYCEYRPTESKSLMTSSDPRKDLEVKKGDLLFTRKNTKELVGATAYVFETPSCLMIPDLIFRLVPEPIEVNPIFLWQALIEPNTRVGIQSLASGAAASMVNISRSRFLPFELPVPPLELQRKFAAAVVALRQPLLSQDTSATTLETLFQTLLHRAFDGSLTAKWREGQAKEVLQEMEHQAKA
jgi:type I restriction enzyme S subunit